MIRTLVLLPNGRSAFQHRFCLYMLVQSLAGLSDVCKYRDQVHVLGSEFLFDDRQLASKLCFCRNELHLSETDPSKSFNLLCQVRMKLAEQAFLQQEMAFH